MKYLINLLLLFAIYPVSAETYCEKVQKYNYYIGVWDNTCGPRPELEYIEEAKYDCETTRKAIEENPGSSWNSEMGWMYEDQCERLERGLDN